MPTVSIVIPSRGGVTRLPHLLDCLTQQTDGDWEAIVVVDGDVDHTQELLDTHPDGRVHSIVFPENRGRVAALNAGFAEASGDVLIRCDDDLRPRSDYVASHRIAHEGEVAGVVGLYRNIYPDTPYASVYGREMDEVFRREAYAAPRTRQWRYWAGNVSVTRETWERVGSYDPDYRAYGWEDVDYGYRLHEAGIPVILNPALETDHHVAATTTQIRATRAFLAGAARQRFEAKHGTEPLEPPGAVVHGWWDRLVSATARASTPRTINAATRVIDAALPRVPRPLAKKLVALAVESAAVGGYRRPSMTRVDV